MKCHILGNIITIIIKIVLQFICVSHYNIARSYASFSQDVRVIGYEIIFYTEIQLLTTSRTKRILYEFTLFPCYDATSIPIISGLSVPLVFSSIVIPSFTIMNCKNNCANIVSIWVKIWEIWSNIPSNQSDLRYISISRKC